MQAAPLPDNETSRLAVLHRYHILDTQAEQSFNDLSTLAAQICQTPIALISFVDETRQWFKARYGLQCEQTERDVSFCAHALLQPDELFIVRDAWEDDRFADNPLVTSPPHVRFYAGAPLVTPDGFVLGTLCVMDQVPHDLSADQQHALKILAQQAMNQLELRRALDELAAVNRRMHDYLQDVGQVTQCAADLEKGDFHSTDLDAMAGRTDELGQLARVFRQAATTLVEREAALQEQVSTLQIEIDQTRRASEVEQITQSDYFQEIKDELANLKLDEFWR